MINDGTDDAYAVVHGDDVNWSPETEAAIQSVIKAAHAYLGELEDEENSSGT